MKIQTYGELLRRIQLNQNRIAHQMYTYPDVLEHISEWSGDFEGRTILSLCCLYSIVEDDQKEKVKAQVQAIIEHLDEKTNEFGYLGKPFDENAVDEQQLSGHSWFLRGLCEYYRLFGDEKVFKRIESISDNYLSLLGKSYQNYPDCERGDGGVDGHLTKVVREGWLLSTDIGCAFIMLDGITDAYSVLLTEKLKSVIEIMIKRFTEFDLVKFNFQTHATLSATRGLLRFYKLTGNSEYLEISKKIFQLYTAYGMTLNYANYNWFGKPLWTEPCAIVDSLIVTSQLYAYTKETEYLKYFNRIYLNAIPTSQRINGGAGCEKCLTEQYDGIKIHMYEAYFCCTMRFAEGLKCLVNFQCVKDSEGVLIPYYNDFVCECEDFNISLRKTGNNEKGNIEINVKADTPIKLSLYVPTNTQFNGAGEYKNGLYVIENAIGDIVIEYSSPVCSESRMGHSVLFTGDVLLSRKNNDKKFTPIGSYIDMKSVEEEEQSIQYFWND